MKNYYKKILSKTYCLICLVTFFSSCKKFIEVPTPSNALNGPAVFTSDATAVATLNGLYVEMSNASFIQGTYGISMLTGLSSDELSLYSSSVNINLIDYYRNNLSNQNDAITWNFFYSYLKIVNSVLEGLSKSTSLTESVSKQLEGEAKFLRAFYYFYLVNLYGDIPLLTTSDWRVNSAASRTPRDQVWQQIITDLKEAQNLLSENYLKGDAKTSYSAGQEERVRPTKWAATALLARAYLYKGDWVNAEVQSSSLINNPGYFELLTNLNGVFLKNSREAIWQLMTVHPRFNMSEAPAFVITSFGFFDGSPAYLSSTLLNAFEANDGRKTEGNWVNSVNISGTTYLYPFKYKVRSRPLNAVPTEYFMVFRLGEQYLIRAEARALQNKIAEAQSDLNMIRNRAGLPNTTANDQASLLNVILHERQVELFAELGHRWLDLKRTGTIDAVMTSITPQKAPGSQWQPTKQYWPIFFRELQLNPNLTQTPGY